MEALRTKYNRPLPRYTSYPPANFFHRDFSAEDFRKELSDSNFKQPELVSIYIHVPFCPQICYYCGCNSVQMNSRQEVKRYADALLKEMQLIFPLLSPSRKIAQIHFGGGTPSTLPLESIQALVELAFRSFGRIPHPEIAMECHPAYLNASFLNGLKQIGFNRISLGIQDFDPKVLQAVNRLPSKLPLQDILSFLREEMKASVNLDFIYGLPHQTPDSFQKSLIQAVELLPDRIVTFPYNHFPQLFPHQKRMEQEKLPSVEDKQILFERASGYLKQNGYFPIGMDHFVLENDELRQAMEEKQLHRNFQGYCSRKTTGQVYAFGVSGISQLASCYAQNTKDIPAYIQSVENGQLAVERGYRLSPDEQSSREIIESLLCNYQAIINPQAWRNEPELQALQDDGLLEIESNQIRVTELGKPFVRNVAGCFDKLLKR